MTEFFKEFRNGYFCGFTAFPSKLFFYKNWSQNHIFTHCRSSRREVFCRKGVLRNLAKFTGKHLWQSLFFNKVAGLIEKEALAQVFSCEFCQISKNIFSYRTPPMAYLRWLLTLEVLKIVFYSMGSPNLQL